MATDRRIALIVLLLLLSLVRVPLALAREVPSAPEIRQMVNDKQHKKALREIARAMQLKGDEAAGYDRGELLLIRADAQLAMRIEPSAAKSYRDAAEAATNDNDRATARAMALLMSRCEQLAFTPRTGDAAGRSIDIVTDREKALEALLADEMATAEPKVRASMESKQIGEVLDTVRAIESVAFVERAATGTAARTDEFKKQFVERIETLLDDALVELDRRASRIEESALGLIALPKDAQPQPAPGTMRVKKRGLSPADEAALRGVMQMCADLVSRHREVALQLGAEPDRFRRASDFAIRLSSKAGAILRADYSGIQERKIDPAAAPAGVERVQEGTLPG